MSSTIDRVRSAIRSTLTAEQQRGVKVLGWASMVVMVGLTTTGLWQFFTHESDPSWFDQILGSSVRQRAAPSDGIAELHSIFGTAAGVVALFGGAWFAYKVAYEVPKLVIAAFGLIVVGLITGSMIRFNAIKVRGREYDEAGRGYPQLFLDDIDYVVTDKWDLGSTAIRLLTITHVATLPILGVAAWYTMTRIGADDR